MVDVSDEKPSFVSRVLGGSRQRVIRTERVRRIELVPCRQAEPCNPYGPVDNSNELDVALLKGDFEGLDVTKWKGAPAPRSSASSGQPIKMLAVDGARTAQLGGLAMFYSLAGEDGRYCFRGLFEVLALPYHPKIVHPGDSGAWIMRHGSTGDEWFGMVLASDELRGFAIFAEPIHDWVRSQGL